MANPEHLALLKQGVAAWNAWRLASWQQHGRSNRPDLTGADLSGVVLRKADLRLTELGFARFDEADLTDCDFGHADLGCTSFVGSTIERARFTGANFHWPSRFADPLAAEMAREGRDIVSFERARGSGAIFSRTSLLGMSFRDAQVPEADFSEADLFGADLSSAMMHSANFWGARLLRANLRGSDLRGANLTGAVLVLTNFENAVLDGCQIYGTSTWDVQLRGASQRGLLITREEEPSIRVDNLEVAQFVYLLLNNVSIRQVIDTITSKVVLLLGRFSADRKPVLDALRNELRRRDLVPVMFDFEKPRNRDYTETVSLLARMARFIIADITDPKSVPQELQAIVPHQATPLLPLLQEDAAPYSMFVDFGKYSWVLPIERYVGPEDLVTRLPELLVRLENVVIATHQART